MIIQPPAMSIPGVTPQAATAVYNTLVQGRRYFGSSGASLTHHANDPDFKSEFKGGMAKVGLAGERDTTNRVLSWMKDKPNVILLDSCHIKGMGASDDGDSDHLLIMGNNVIIIDTKRWKSKRSYSISDKGTVLRDNRKFEGGSRVHAKQAKFMWKKYLGKGVVVSSVVCVNNEKVFVKYDANWKKSQFKLVTAEKLTETLDWHYNRLSDDQKNTINSTTVAKIAVTCIKPYDGFYKVFNEKALENFR